MQAYQVATNTVNGAILTLQPHEEKKKSILKESSSQQHRQFQAHRTKIETVGKISPQRGKRL